LHIIKNKFQTKTAGLPEIATFATIVNPALLICPHMQKAPLTLAIRYMHK